MLASEFVRVYFGMRTRFSLQSQISNTSGMKPALVVGYPGASYLSQVVIVERHLRLWIDVLQVPAERLALQPLPETEPLAHVPHFHVPRACRCGVGQTRTGLFTRRVRGETGCRLDNALLPIPWSLFLTSVATRQTSGQNKVV